MKNNRQKQIDNRFFWKVMVFVSFGFLIFSLILVYQMNKTDYYKEQMIIMCKITNQQQDVIDKWVNVREDSNLSNAMYKIHQQYNIEKLNCEDFLI